MKWLSALFLGAILAFVLPLAFGGQGGFWMHTWTKWGTIRPIAGSPGFCSQFRCGWARRWRYDSFNWHSR